MNCVIYRKKPSEYLQFLVEDESRKTLFVAESQDALEYPFTSIIKESNDREVARIEYKCRIGFEFFTSLRYEIYRSGELYATIKRRCFCFGDQYLVSIANAYEFKVKQGFFNVGSLLFVKDGIEIAQVRRKFFSDFCRVNISENADSVLIIASIIAIFFVPYYRGA